MNLKPDFSKVKCDVGAKLGSLIFKQNNKATLM